MTGIRESVIEERADEPRAREASGRTETICDRIEERARAHPARTAILAGETEIAYGRLVERADAIAGELAARGVEPGSLVGVCAGRTWELVATLLGVLRAGCAYVPLDPAYPRERVRYMLEHSRAAVAIVDGEASARRCEGVAEIVRIDAIGDRTADDATRPSAHDLAYVMYTSGSTGRPKGVAVEHRSLVALSRATRDLLDDEDLAGVLTSTSICFDASVLEIFATLSLGGTLVLAENALALLDLPSADRVRTCILVPSALRTVLAAGRLPASVRCVVFGGEVLHRSLVESLHALEPRPRVLNVYGPTEDTVYSTATEVPVGAETITIGKSVPGSRAWILDESLRPVPVGAPGELHLAGDQLARGYLHDEARTKERFLELDADGPIPEERLYKTGDLCRWRDDGEIEFLGRIDRQVKLRGFRIELGEIESALETMDGVDGAAAAVLHESHAGESAASENGQGRPRLVAWVASRNEAVTNESARAHLAERLPPYMVPQVVTRLDELPLLPSGKLDRESLPRPSVLPVGDAGGPDAGSHAGSPDAGGPDVLAIIRREIASMLDADPAQVSPESSFYDLGLDSLTTVELSSRLDATLGRELPVSVVLERATPAAVADWLLESTADDALSKPGPNPKPNPKPGVEARGGAVDPLGRFQAQTRTGYPPFLAAQAPAWEAGDKATFLRELKLLMGRDGRDPYTKLVRTGSGHRGVVADTHTGEEREAVIWTTNLYLGLNRDPQVIEEARSAVERFGTGMGTSSAAAGVTDQHLEFEKEFAELVGKPAACLFPTGYTANLGAIAGVLGEKDVVVMDQLCHASIVDGARLSGAKIRTFRHDSATDLEAVLATEASSYRTVLVVFEGVYSMGEGAAPVEELLRVAKKYGALTLVDEAHSFGFYGALGAGICAERGVTDQADFLMTTLSKALGSLGGVVAASEEYVTLLKSASRAFLFQASISPADIAAALAALRRIRDDDALRDRLWNTTRYMRQRFTDAGYDLGEGDGPVVTPLFPDTNKLFAMVDGLSERGVLTSAVTYPVVESGRSRMRFLCSATHTREDVDHTIESLIEVEREVEKAPPVHVEGSGAARAPERPTIEIDEVERWAADFAAHLEKRLGEAPVPAPRLAVSVALPGAEEPITIEVDGRAARTARAGEARAEAPACSLRLHDRRAASALVESDVQELLGAVLEGSCELHGQVEPFVWFLGRMADRRREASVRYGRAR